jgi:hypothetical protein
MPACRGPRRLTSAQGRRRAVGHVQWRRKRGWWPRTAWLPVTAPGFFGDLPTNPRSRRTATASVGTASSRSPTRHGNKKGRSVAAPARKNPPGVARPAFRVQRAPKLYLKLICQVRGSWMYGSSDSVETTWISSLQLRQLAWICQPASAFASVMPASQVS